MNARKLTVSGTGVVDLGEGGRDTTSRVQVHFITNGATYTATFRASLDPAKQPLGPASPQRAYTIHKSGVLTDGATAITDVTAGAESSYEVPLNGGHLGLHVTAITGSLLLLVGPVLG